MSTQNQPKPDYLRYILDINKIAEEFSYGDTSSNWHEESEKWESADKLKILCNLRKIINTAKEMEEELLKDFSK